MSKRILIFLSVCCSLIYLSLGGVSQETEQIANNKQSKSNLYKARVKEIIFQDKKFLSNGQAITEQLLELEVEIKKNFQKQVKKIELVHTVPEDLAFKLYLKKNDRVIVSEEEGSFVIESLERDYVCYFLILAFVLSVLIIGKRKGLFACLALALSGLLLFFLVIPLIKKGVSPLLLASLFCVISTAFTAFLVTGWNLKTLAASLGTASGSIAAGLIGVLAVKSARLSHLLEQEIVSIYYQFPKIDLNELLAAGILISALGAAMDVGISIASSVHEVYLAAPQKSWRELYSVGIKIGQDVMGTMVDTLILAYAGSSLPVIILISEVASPFLLNVEFVVKEIILYMVWSIALILTVPITALSSALLLKRKIKVKVKVKVS